MDDSVPEAQRFAIRPATAGPAGLAQSLAAWAARRHWSPLLAAAVIVAMLAVLALLLAFTGVMRDAVEQGESRRRATAQHWESVWRCNALRDRNQKQACLAQHNVVVQDAGAPGAATAAP